MTKKVKFYRRKGNLALKYHLMFGECLYLRGIRPLLHVEHSVIQGHFSTVNPNGLVVYNFYVFVNKFYIRY